MPRNGMCCAVQRQSIRTTTEAHTIVPVVSSILVCARAIPVRLQDGAPLFRAIHLLREKCSHCRLGDTRTTYWAES